MLKFALQLYSVRNVFAKDPMGTLEQISQAGYHYIEAANHNSEVDDGVGFGISSDKMLDMLQRFNLKIISTHVFPLRNTDRLQDILRYNQEIDNHMIALPSEYYANVDELKEKSYRYNKIGELCKKYDIQFMHHNHFHEWRVLPGADEPIFDLVLKYSDPDLVKFQLDTYWATRGGQEPVELLKKHGDRIAMLHEKDIPHGMTEPINLMPLVDWTEADKTGNMQPIYSAFAHDTFVEIGDGIMDHQSIVDAANEVGTIEYIALEQDFTKLDEIESIKRSMNNFRKLRGVEC